MAMAVLSVQAQTCKVSATKNNGKVVQISVNLDSLKGKTLVTTISQVKKNVILNMAYEDKVDTINTVIAREDSSELAKNDIDVDVADVEPNEETDVKPESEPEGETEGETEDGTEGETEGETEDGTEGYKSSQGSSVMGGVLGIFGLNNVTSLVSGNVNKDSLEYYEEYGKKLITSLTQADSTKYIPQYKQRKWKWLDKYKSYSTLELSGIFGRDFGEEPDGAEEVKSEDYGIDPDKEFNLGGSAKFSQVFIPGKYSEDGSFKPNRLHFGWSIGALFAVDYQKDYGWSTDLLAKVGIQAGDGITLGIDALIGSGTSPYAIYSTDGLNYRAVVHNQWCFKYGAQAWVSMNYGGNTYTTLFARLVKSVAPGSIYDHPTAKYWDNVLIDFDKGSWQVGFAVGYKFGYNPDLKSKRLQATLSTGYNLIGCEKSAEMLIELEKINRVSPKLDFCYGFGFGQSLGHNSLQSFTLNGGWFFKLKQTHKLYYMAKLYAGVGEYMVGKKLKTEDNLFELSCSNIRQICLKGGVNLGAGFRFRSNTLTASMRIGYHGGFAPEYSGYKTMEDTNLSGWDVTPMINYTINF